MTPKEFLRQVYKENQEVVEIKEQLDVLRSLASKTTSTPPDKPMSDGGVGLDFDIVISEIVELEEEYYKKVEHALTTRAQVKACIDMLDKPTYRRVLNLRYMYFMSWDEISLHMTYSIRHIHKLHGQALQEIKMPHNATQCH